MSQFSLLNPSSWFPFWRRNDGFYSRNSYMLGYEGPIWLPVNKPFELYEKIPQLHMIVNKKALMRSNVCIKLVDKKTGEEKIIDELYRLLEKPNVYDSQNQFLMQRVIQKEIYGTQFTYKNQPNNKLFIFPASISNISPRYLAPYFTGKVFDQTELKGIISHYEYRDSKGASQRYETEQILMQKIADLDNPIMGRSPLVSLKYPMSNIEAAYEYGNKIMRKMGALGILTSESKDSSGGGAVPMSEPEKKRIQEDYIDRMGAGENQQAILLTKASVKFQHTAFPVKQMMLFEHIDTNTTLMCDTFGMNVNIFSNANATYENVKESIIQTYQDTIIPETDQDFQALSTFILPLEIQKTHKLVGDFSHVQILKADKKSGIEATKQLCDGLAELVANQIITTARANEIIETELTMLINKVLY